MDSPLPLQASQEWSSTDHSMMSLALTLAKKGQYTARPNPMVGCVLVKNDRIIGQGWHQKSGLNHAEINALEEAGGESVGATCYVTLEPCCHYGKTGPCASALIKAGVTKVIAAMLDPNPQVAGKGFQVLIAAGIEVKFGLLEAQAKVLNKGFVSKFTRNRPWLTCKLAMSIDGRTALENGASQWITAEAARNDVQKLRARQDAIITGIGTVLSDDPSLNVRADDQDWFLQAKAVGFVQPARILLDRKAQADESAKIFNNDTLVYWMSEECRCEEPKANLDHLLRVHQKKDARLVEQLEYMAELGFNQVLLEAGHKLAGEFLKQGLIDELIIYMAPKLMGDKAKGLFALNVESMTETPLLKLVDICHFSNDIRLTYHFKTKSN